jgi:Flp pilus assembly protein TadD
MIDQSEFEDDDEARSGYIACRACGARIAASRSECLRCGEPLAPAPETVTLSHISTGRPLLITIGIGAVLLAAGGLFWMYRPRIEDEAARPYTPTGGAAPSRSASPAPAAAAPAREASAPAQVLFKDEPLDAFGSEQGASTGNLEAERARLEQAVAQNPNDPESLNGLGKVLAASGDRDGARARFAHAIDLASDRPEYHANLARVLGDQGQWSAAALEYRIAARLLPTDYTTAFNAALAFHRAGNDEAAIPEYQTAIRLAPAQASFHAALGVSLEKAGRTAEAREEFERYLELAPATPEAPAIRAHLQEIAGP